MPHVYYFVILDCSNKMVTTFANEGLKRPYVLTELSMRNKIDEQLTHFSYEDVGLLKLNVGLFIILTLIVLRLWTDYCKQPDSKCLSPHPIMLFASLVKVLSVGLSVANLYTFSREGEGYLAMEVFTKILDGFAETAMSLLLIQMASGWTLTHNDNSYQ